MNAAVPDPTALTSLAGGGRRCLGEGAARIADGLPAMLDALRGISFFGAAAPALPLQQVPVADALANLFAGVRAPFEVVDASGLLGDPWAAAALRREEVRNASVLRWFLDPRGRHGCGDTMLADLLARVCRELPDGFPDRPSARCSISVEECPDGDRASRVDIQVDDPAFFLVVEVKIDAPEQPGQIARYCDVAAARVASARPWAVVFLTIDGRSPTSVGARADRVVTISWAQVATSLRRAARSSAPVPRFLAASFAAHISNL